MRYELVGLLYQQSMILTILALYLINMRSKQTMILEAILIPLIPNAQLPITALQSSNIGTNLENNRQVWLLRTFEK